MGNTESAVTEVAGEEERADPYVKVTPNPIFQWNVTVGVENYAQGYVVEWGDGTRRDTVAANGTARHAYPARPAAWQVQVFAADGKTFVTQQLVVVRGGRAPKGYEIGRNPDNTNEVWVEFQDTGDNTGVLPKFAIEWPKTKDRIEAWGVPGAMVTRLLPDGDHEVTVTDLTSHRAATEQVHVTPPDYDPDYIFRRKPGGDTLTAEIEFIKVTENKEIIVGWDDPEVPNQTITSAKVGDKVEHTYKEPPEGETTRHILIVGYSDETGVQKPTDFRVPLA